MGRPQISATDVGNGATKLASRDANLSTSNSEEIANSSKRNGNGNGKSSVETAGKVGVSPRQVERARAVNSDPEIRAKVDAGKTSLAKGATEVAAKRRTAKEANKTYKSIKPYKG